MDRELLITAAKDTVRCIKEKKYGSKELELSSEEMKNCKVYSNKTVCKMRQSADNVLKKYAGYPTALIKVVNSDSFDEGCRWTYEGVNGSLFSRVCVHNFANAYNPGGGFKIGSVAQEECLCRRSTLWASIGGKNADAYYKSNEKRRKFAGHPGMIFSPYVEVFKTKELEYSQSSRVLSVITSAAPNLNEIMWSPQKKDILRYMKQRIRDLCLVCEENGINTLITGAWGCGAFGHSPEIIAQAFDEVINKEGYGRMLEYVIFAIYGEGDNLNAFKQRYEQKVG